MFSNLSHVQFTMHIQYLSSPTACLTWWRWLEVAQRWIDTRWDTGTEPAQKDHGFGNYRFFFHIGSLYVSLGSRALTQSDSLVKLFCTFWLETCLIIAKMYIYIYGSSWAEFLPMVWEWELWWQLSHRCFSHEAHRAGAVQDPYHGKHSSTSMLLLYIGLGVHVQHHKRKTDGSCVQVGCTWTSDLVTEWHACQPFLSTQQVVDSRQWDTQIYQCCGGMLTEVGAAHCARNSWVCWACRWC